MGTLPKRRTLIIAPHADDETFGCGGTLLRLLEERTEVAVRTVVAGTTKFYHSGEKVEASTRCKEFTKVMKFFGVTNYETFFQQQSTDFGSWPSQMTRSLDGKLDSIPLLNIIRKIERTQQEFRAERWFIPGPSFHQDHEVVSRACIAAGRPFTSFAPKEILMYELPTYEYGAKHLKFEPTVFVDISKHLKKKLKAVQLYKSQLRPKTNSLNSERLAEWARVRGAQAGIEAAEAFELLLNVV